MRVDADIANYDATHQHLNMFVRRGVSGTAVQTITVVTGTGGQPGGQSATVMLAAESAVDTSASFVVDVTAQWSFASAQNSFLMRHGLIELL